jgi:uncharacterized protein (DUF1015 family)
LLPAGSAEAVAISAPNYDEFQSDLEVQSFIRGKPSSVLRVTMPHADPFSSGPTVREGSPGALARAARTLEELIQSRAVREIEDLLWVYEISDPGRPGRSQIGLGGMALTSEIRSPENPGGVIIRNEGVRPQKVRGRAGLIRHTGAVVGTVNLAVEDSRGTILQMLREYAGGCPPELELHDEGGNRHRVWTVKEPRVLRDLTVGLEAEPAAYVADGNHRSAAAAMLGLDQFPAVFFPVETMEIRPYNRLVGEVRLGEEAWGCLAQAFEIRAMGGIELFQPAETHRVGLYADGQWHELRPRPWTFDPEDAVQVIDADIVQRMIFDRVFGISDSGDPRITFVGGNRDVAYLRAQVDRGESTVALTLPPVTLEQFVEVCRQNRMMPPKSTWFEPKVRSGLVMALL